MNKQIAIMEVNPIIVAGPVVKPTSFSNITNSTGANIVITLEKILK